MSQALNQGDIRFSKEVFLNGLAADFMVYAPDGRQAAIEIKSWGWKPGNRARAGHVSELLLQRLEVDAVFVVIDGIEKNWPSENVFRIDGVAPAIQRWLGLGKDLEVDTPLKSTKSKPKKSKRKIFVAMPFSTEYDDTFYLAISEAAEAENAVAIRVGLEEFTGDIVQKILDELGDCDALIVDLSEAKPNVMYEAGFGHALSKPCVHICSTPIKELPFDVSHLNTIEYKKGQVHLLKEKLTKRLSAALAGK